MRYFSKNHQLYYCHVTSQSFSLYHHCLLPGFCTRVKLMTALHAFFTFRWKCCSSAYVHWNLVRRKRN